MARKQRIEKVVITASKIMLRGSSGGMLKYVVCGDSSNSEICPDDG